MAAEASDWFIEDGSWRARLLHRCIGQGWFRASVTVIEQLTIPGILLHYLLRKKYLEEVVRDRLAKGCKQVVVLGAGFDTLALRLQQEFPEALFIELDHPATQGAKREALAVRQVRPRGLRFLAIDLARDLLEQTLLDCGDFDPSAPTVFVAEGLLMYFPVEKVREIFRFVRAHAGSKSVFAFTFLEPRADGRIGFRRSGMGVDWWLTLRGEPFQWGINWNDLPGFLKANGFALHNLVTHEILRARYLTTAGLGQARLAEGECICVAEPA
jgi:methyltransferase (TIGR00027 family)